jgi:hypothetical protein
MYVHAVAGGGGWCGGANVWWTGYIIQTKPNISLDIQLQNKILLQDKGQLANVRKEEEREASEF